MKADVETAINALVAAGDLPDDLDRTRVVVGPPREAAHGDIATNAAMVLSKAAGAKPRDLARKLVKRLELGETVARIDVAGPGFINMTLSDAFWRDRLRDILKAGRSYGDSGIGAGRKVNVEYVSANPTGPMHVGHARGAVVGDVLANLLTKAGYDVTREYYVNDAGAQVDILARSAYLRYLEALGEDIGGIPKNFYPGDYLIPVGEALVKKYGETLRGAPESAWLADVRIFAVDAMMTMIRDDLAALGVKHDVFSSERALVEAGGVDAVLETLTARGLIYEGVPEPPKGKKTGDWEAREQTLFKATEFGDDVDRPLKKSDGAWTYFAGDMAYHLDKYRRGFADMIDVWGADHGGYAKRIEAGIEALTENGAALDVKLCQMVNLLDDGLPVRMSKRAGTFVKLRDMIDKVGGDAVRFIMLTRRNDAHLDFDFKRVTEQSRENPVFYVQYAHARICSVMRLAAGIFGADAVSMEALRSRNLDILSSDSEIALMKRMADWPRLVEGAAESHEPHRIAYYLGELAGDFHGLWNKGRDDASLRFIREDEPDLTMARLALLRAAASVIVSGLDVFGVKPVEEMRDHDD